MIYWNKTDSFYIKSRFFFYQKGVKQNFTAEKRDFYTSFFCFLNRNQAASTVYFAKYEICNHIEI
ncbi:hypothetical protein AUL54_13595 [Bacillus sp. SDLI1]|nr:hypothetical protein AUL54_13595 [Bacillus sp. SDLI1]